MHVQNFGGKTKSMVVFLKLAYWYIDAALCVAICKTVGQLFKRRLGRVLRWFDPVFLGGYRPTLKLSGIPTFTFIESLTHRMDNI